MHILRQQIFGCNSWVWKNQNRVLLRMQPHAIFYIFTCNIIEVFSFYKDSFEDIAYAYGGCPKDQDDKAKIVLPHDIGFFLYLCFCLCKKTVVTFCVEKYYAHYDFMIIRLTRSMSFVGIHITQDSSSRSRVPQTIQCWTSRVFCATSVHGALQLLQSTTTIFGFFLHTFLVSCGFFFFILTCYILATYTPKLYTQ